MNDQALLRGAVRDDLLRALVHIAAGQRIQQQLVAGDVDGPTSVGRVAVPGVGAEDAAGSWVVKCLVGEVVIFRENPTALESPPILAEVRITTCMTQLCPKVY